MLSLVNGAKPYIKPKPKVDVPRADNLVFRLHYRVKLYSIVFEYIMLVVFLSFSWLES